MLQSQLSERGASLVEEIQSSVMEDSEKLAVIESACPNWRDHVKYANLRVDACGIRDARDRVRETLSHLNLIRGRVLEVWSKQQCVLELYETTLEHALTRFDNSENMSQIKIAPNEVAIEVADDDDMSKHDCSTFEPTRVYTADISEAVMNDEITFPLSQPPILNENENIIDSTNKDVSTRAHHMHSELTKKASDLSPYEQITAALSASNLRVPILERKTIEFEQFMQVLRACSLKVTKKMLFEYLDSQGIPFSAAWRQKKHGSKSQVDGSDCNSESD